MWSLIFWLASFFVIYTFIGYPLLIQLIAKRKATLPATEPETWPSIGLVIPVHNEAGCVEKKLLSINELDYPKEKMTVTFVSDGSEDNTVEVIEALSQTEPFSALTIKSIQYAPRAGKPTALNHGVAAQDCDILIMTDARQNIDKSAIKRLVARLNNPSIGAVSGELVFLDPETHTGANVGLYWRYEKWIRDAESRVHSVAGVTGALYAIRREDFKPLYPEAILDDFEVPMAILKQGKRIVFEAGAEVYDAPQEASEREKQRKIRTLTGNFQSFAHNSWLFSPFKNPIAWQFISHKVFRLFVPYALLLTLISSLLAPGPFYKVIFLAQLIAYGAVAATYFKPTLKENRLLNFMVVFLELNWASVVALKKFATGEVEIKWQKT